VNVVVEKESKPEEESQPQPQQQQQQKQTKVKEQEEVPQTPKPEESGIEAPAEEVVEGVTEAIPDAVAESVHSEEGWYQPFIKLVSIINCSSPRPSIRTITNRKAISRDKC